MDQLGARVVEVVVRQSRVVRHGVVEGRIQIADEIGVTVAIGVGRSIRLVGVYGGTPARFQAVRQAVTVAVGRERIGLAVDVVDVHVAIEPGFRVGLRQVSRIGLVVVVETVVVIVEIVGVTVDHLAEDDGDIPQRTGFHRIGISIGVHVGHEVEVALGHVSPQEIPVSPTALGNGIAGDPVGLNVGDRAAGIAARQRQVAAGVHHRNGNRIGIDKEHVPGLNFAVERRLNPGVHIGKPGAGIRFLDLQARVGDNLCDHHQVGADAQRLPDLQLVAEDRSGTVHRHIALLYTDRTGNLLFHAGHHRAAGGHIHQRRYAGGHRRDGIGISHAVGKHDPDRVSAEICLYPDGVLPLRGIRRSHIRKLDHVGHAIGIILRRLNDGDMRAVVHRNRAGVPAGLQGNPSTPCVGMQYFDVVHEVRITVVEIRQRIAQGMVIGIHVPLEPVLLPPLGHTVYLDQEPVAQGVGVDPVGQRLAEPYFQVIALPHRIAIILRPGHVHLVGGCVAGDVPCQGSEMTFGIREIQVGRRTQLQ